MKKVKEKLTAMLNAVTFAEAGEHQAAIEYLDQSAQDHPTAAVVGAAASRASAAGRPGLIRTLEDQMVAAAFAEAGELDAARRMLETEPRPKAVLLVLDSRQIDRDAFIYAANLCQRIAAEMEVVAFSAHIEKDTSPEDLSAMRAVHDRLAHLSRAAEKQGVACRVTVQAGNIDHQLFEYVRTHKEVAAVIYGSNGMRNTAGYEVGLRRALESVVAKLAVPMVRVLRKRTVGAHS